MAGAFSLDDFGVLVKELVKSDIEPINSSWWSHIYTKEAILYIDDNKWDMPSPTIKKQVFFEIPTVTKSSCSPPISEPERIFMAGANAEGFSLGDSFIFSLAFFDGLCSWESNHIYYLGGEMKQWSAIRMFCPSCILPKLFSLPSLRPIVCQRIT